MTVSIAVAMPPATRDPSRRRRSALWLPARADRRALIAALVATAALVALPHALPGTIPVAAPHTATKGRGALLAPAGEPIPRAAPHRGDPARGAAGGLAATPPAVAAWRSAPRSLREAISRALEPAPAAYAFHPLHGGGDESLLAGLPLAIGADGALSVTFPGGASSAGALASPAGRALGAAASAPPGPAARGGLAPTLLGRLDGSVPGSAGGGDLGRLQAAKPLGHWRLSAAAAGAHTLVLQGAGVSEQLVNGPSSLEQRFVVERRPAGDGPLVLSLQTRGDLRASATTTGSVTLAGPGSDLTYSGLHVRDAAGRVLPAHLAVDGGALRIVIDDAGARYPIDVDPTISTGSNFISLGGTSLAISSNGDVALVGAATNETYNYDFGVEDGSGLTYVFEKTAGGWTTAQLTEYGLLKPVFGEEDAYQSWNNGDDFGWSVALSADGTVAVIGAPHGNYEQSRSGEAWVVSLALAGNQIITTLDSVISEPQGTAFSGDDFGAAVAAADPSGAIEAVVGAPHEGSGGSTGAVYVFDGPVLDRYGNGNEENDESPTQTLTDSNLVVSQESGFARWAGLGASVAVSSDGSTILAGAPYAETSGGTLANAGVLDEFSAPGYGADTIETGATAGGELGTSVAITPSGSYAVAGEPDAGSSSPQPAGDVRYLDLATSSAEEITPANPVSGEGFGTAVSISDDGSEVLVGAPLTGYAAGTNRINTSASQGDAFLETGTAGNFSSPSEQQVTPPVDGGQHEQGTGINGSYFGEAVALAGDGSYALVGAPWDNYYGSNGPGDTWRYSIIGTTPPQVSGVSPAIGISEGGTAVVISGTGFTGATAVHFGTNAASDVQVVDDGEITATAPAGSGTVDVTVTGPAGTSATSAADTFLYIEAAPPTLLASANQGNEVQPVDLRAGRAGNPIDVDAGPETIAVSPDGNTAYVVSQQLDSLTSINVATGAIVDDFSFVGDGHSCYGVALSPDGSTAYVTCTEPAKVLVLDLSGGSISFDTTISLPDTVAECLDIVVTADGSTGYVSCAGAGGGLVGVEPIDLEEDTAGTPITSASFGQLHGIAVSADGSTVYVGDYTHKEVFPISFGSVEDEPTVTIGSPVTVTNPPTNLLLSPDGSTLYAAGAGGVITPIATSGMTVRPNIVLPGGALGTTSLAISADGTTMYAANDASNGSVYPVDLTQSPPVVGDALASGYDFVSVALATPTVPIGPYVTGVSPDYGASDGGTAVTISGTGFTAATEVDFGQDPASGVQVVSDSAIEATSPSGSGTVDVTVSGPGGTSATSASDQFSYLPWLRAAPVALPSGAKSGEYLDLYSVACPSVGNCSAVGYYFDRNVKVQAMVEDEVGAVWQQAEEVDLPPGAQTSGNLGTTVLDDVSCSSTGNCTAVGSYIDGSGDEQGLIVEEIGGVWQQGSELDLPPGTSFDAFGGVSCAPGGLCSAIGTLYDASFFTQGFVLDEQPGGTWDGATEVTLPYNAVSDSDPEVSMFGISCASTGNCAAVGEYKTDDNGQTAMLLDETGGVWQGGSPVGLPSTAEAAMGGSLTAVSCPAVARCVAVGTDTRQGTGTTGLLGVEQGGPASDPVWQTGTDLTLTTSSQPASNLDDSFSSISCPAVNECAAVGWYDNASYDQEAFEVDLTPSGWATAGQTQLPANSSPYPRSDLTSVSCAAVGECSAVGWYLGAPGNEGLLLDEIDGSWQPAEQMAPPPDAALDPQVALNSVSCAAAQYCAAVGTYSTSSGLAALTLNALGAPAVTSVHPTDAVPDEQVTVSGYGFTGASEVELECECGTQPYVVPAFTPDGDSELSFDAPSAADLSVVSTTPIDVLVLAPGGTSLQDASDEFTLLVSPPVVSSLNFSSEPAEGGDSISISGSGFTGATGVHFGSVPAAGFTVEDDDDVSAVIPPGNAGTTVDVMVTTPLGTSTIDDGDELTYLPAPVLSSLGPAIVSPQGGQVTLAGSGFSGVDPSSGSPCYDGEDSGVWLFGYGLFPIEATSYQVDSDNSMTVQVPPLPRGALSVTGTVVVADDCGSSGDLLATGDELTYGAVVSALGPSAGALAGGNEVVVDGSGLAQASQVNFGATPAPWFSVVSDEEIVASAPSGSAGPVEVVVVTPAGDSTAAQSGSDTYTYTSPPEVSSVNPASAAPFTEVTIDGSGFTGAARVDFSGPDSGDLYATSFTVVSGDEIQAEVPNGDGLVDVLVSGPGGTSSASPPGDQFSFDPSSGTPASAPVPASTTGGSSAGGAGAPSGTGPSGSGAGSGTAGSGGSGGTAGAPPAAGSGPAAPARTPGTGAPVPLLAGATLLPGGPQGPSVVLELRCAGRRACRGTATLVEQVERGATGGRPSELGALHYDVARRGEARLRWPLTTAQARRLAAGHVSLVLDLRSGAFVTSQPVAFRRPAAARARASARRAQALVPKSRSRRGKR